MPSSRPSLAACLAAAIVLPAATASSQRADARADTLAIAALARELSTDSMRGRGPYTAENLAAARRLAAGLAAIGGRPLLGTDILVPFTTEARPRDTVYNVVAVLPTRSGQVSRELIGITAHFDHLGVGQPDSTGDAIYNGFLDAAVPVAMVMDVARRYSQAPGERSLVVFYFNLEEQRLLGAQALLARRDADDLVARLKLLIGVDAGSPAGEAIEWQLMGTVPDHAGARLADSLAAVRGWTTTRTAPRPISDVWVFSQRGVPIVFPIPGRVWRGYTDDQRNAAMARFDHYHRPSDEYHPEFPWIGTAHFADWLYDIVMAAADARAETPEPASPRLQELPTQ